MAVGFGPGDIARRTLGWTVGGVSTVADIDNNTSRNISAHFTTELVGVGN